MMPTESMPEDELVEVPYLRFYHSQALRAKTLNVLTTIEQAKDATRYHTARADLIMELTNAGMDYYFLQPLKLAKVGFVVEQSATVGLSGATRVLAGVIHNIVGHMDRTQMLVVCDYIRDLME